MGEVGILNVGAGDTKLVFDKNSPQDCIRAARVVKDMLKRGYALLVAVEEGGKTVYRRATEFREDTFEYIIADFDPVEAAEHDRVEAEGAENEQSSKTIGAAPKAGAKKRTAQKLRGVAASSTNAVAVPRSAGG